MSQLKEQSSHGETPLHIAAKQGDIKAINMLIKAKANLEAQDKDGHTPLHWAAGWGTIESIDALLKARANLEAITSYGKTPLHWAAERGGKEAIDMILKAGANVEATDFWRKTPLHLAATWNKVESIDALLKARANLEVIDKDGKTPLHLAAELGKREAVGALVKARANLEAIDKDSKTPLHVAAARGMVVSIGALLKAKANLEAQTLQGFTPLHLASGKGSIEIIDALVKARANLEAIDKDGKTPLHVAAARGVVVSIGALLKAKANLEAIDKDGQTPLHVAAKSGKIEAIRALLKVKASLEAIDENGYTPLHVAALYGMAGVIVELVEAGANRDATNKYGYTPLHLVAKYGNIESIGKLLEAGANLEAIDKNGKTPLHLAAKYGNINVIDALVKAKANLEAIDKDGKTPLHVVVEKGAQDEVKILLTYTFSDFILNDIIKMDISNTEIKDLIQERLGVLQSSSFAASTAECEPVIPIIDQSNTRSGNVEERKPILNRCAQEIMQRDAVGDRYRIGISTSERTPDAAKQKPSIIPRSKQKPDSQKLEHKNIQALTSIVSKMHIETIEALSKVDIASLENFTKMLPQAQQWMHQDIEHVARLTHEVAFQSNEIEKIRQEIGTDDISKRERKIINASDKLREYYITIRDAIGDAIHAAYVIRSGSVDASQDLTQKTIAALQNLGAQIPVFGMVSTAIGTIVSKALEIKKTPKLVSLANLVPHNESGAFSEKLARGLTLAKQKEIENIGNVVPAKVNPLYKLKNFVTDTLQKLDDTSNGYKTTEARKFALKDTDVLMEHIMSGKIKSTDVFDPHPLIKELMEIVIGEDAASTFVGKYVEVAASSNAQKINIQVTDDRKLAKEEGTPLSGHGQDPLLQELLSKMQKMEAEHVSKFKQVEEENKRINEENHQLHLRMHSLRKKISDVHMDSTTSSSSSGSQAQAMLSKNAISKVEGAFSEYTLKASLIIMREKLAYLESRQGLTEEAVVDLRGGEELPLLRVEYMDAALRAELLGEDTDAQLGV